MAGVGKVCFRQSPRQARFCPLEPAGQSMQSKRVIFALIVALAGSWFSYAPAASITVAAGEARMTLLVDQGSDAQPGTYEITVSRASIKSVADHGSQHRKVSIADWRLTIRCIDECACPQTYNEDLGLGSAYSSGLMGVWQVLDVSPAIVTSWQSGQTYNISIYGCRSGHIEKWLNEGAASVPTVTAGTDSIDMPVVSFPHDRYGSSAAVWTWNGERYVKSDAPN